MKKIPNLFLRDWTGDKNRVLPVFNSEADVAWVAAGEGTPTVKWDGSACLVRDGRLFARYDAKRGKVPPAGFEACQNEDPLTGRMPGWVPAADASVYKWHLNAFENSCGMRLRGSKGPVAFPLGTYEACGPQFQSNPYKLPRNVLIRHGAHPVGVVDIGADPAEAHAVLRQFFTVFRLADQAIDMPAALPIEGIVWHHPDGRMVKVLASDLGLAWKAKNREEKA